MSGQLTDTGWFAGFLLLCVAALQPSPAPAAAVAPTRRVAAGCPTLSRWWPWWSPRCPQCFIRSSTRRLRHLWITPASSRYASTCRRCRSTSGYGSWNAASASARGSGAQRGTAAGKRAAVPRRGAKPVRRDHTCGRDAIIQFTTPSIPDGPGISGAGAVGHPDRLPGAPRDQAGVPRGAADHPAGTGRVGNPGGQFHPPGR